MRKLTYSQFVELIRNKGARIVGIEAVTDARAKKTGNPFGIISKHSRSVGFVGAEYQNGVRREGERQGADSAEFEAAPLPWGSWEIKNKVIFHKGERFLRTQSTPGQRKRQAAKVLRYIAENGETLTREQVKPFLPIEKGSEKQAAVGIEAPDQVMVRNFKFDSIRKVRINGATFQLVRD